MGRGIFAPWPGANSSAVGEREGKLVTASGGTLLLDEIETISPRAQVQLLRVLDDGVVMPLGRAGGRGEGETEPFSATRCRPALRCDRMPRARRSPVGGRGDRGRA
ncbi:MAG: sigma 54-interacting transcriptional regulator [Spirochaetes bacterium]|nr:sigma 54-interacting transcriptional regulator [Spirochaetota bacterium]